MNNFIKINRIIATKITKLFTLLLALFASVGTMFAWDYERVQIGDLYYNLDDATQTAEVTYEKMDLLYGAYSTLPRVLIISSSVTYNGNEYTITTIGSLAFAGCSFDSVSIPNTVKTIKAQAFYKCSLINITIPESVESIEAYAFEGGIINVNYSGNATGSPWGAKIVNGYFDGAFVFNDKTQTILYAWKEDPLQKDISIPNTVKTIRDRVFQYCHYIETITLPNGLESIGECAFSGCDRLKSLSVPNSVTNIDILAFEDVFNISYTGTASGAPWGAKSMNGYIEFPLLFNNLNKDTLVACYHYAEGNIAIPNTVSVIGKDAFSSCYNITSVTIPSSVTSIAKWAFERCSGIVIPIEIPISVTTIEPGAFNDVFNIQYYGSAIGAPWGARSMNGLVELPLVYNDDKTSLLACARNAEGNISIASTVDSIAKEAFEYCNKIVSVSIPSALKYIGKDAFYSCSGMTEVHISDLVAWCNIYFDGKDSNPTKNAHHLYLNNEEIKKIVIPDEVTSIGRYAFVGCNSIMSVVIPNSVDSIREGAFYECCNLKTIYVVPVTPPTIYSNTFSYCASDADVIVDNHALDAYNNAEYWKDLNIKGMDFITIKVIANPTSVTISIMQNLWVINDNYIVSIGIEGREQQPGNVLEHIGLEPNSEYKDRPVVLTSNTGETETVNVSFTTTALELTTKPSKPVSSTTAILLAETNMADAETNCGFEWKRNDAPADMADTKVYCPVASGQMAGRLKNLKDDVYYKYRAFYESAAGMMYYGDWQYIFTGDESVEFQPIINTYAATAITEHQATLRGYALEGSEDFTEQGFEYWVESRLKTNKMPARNQKSQIGEKKTITASGISMKVTLMELDPGSVYKYRTYAKIGNQTVYGSEMSFTTLGEWVAYTVTFVGKDGKVISTQEVEPGDDAIAPEAPEVDGFRFTGWDIEFTNVQSNLIVTAQYTEIVMVTLVVTSSDTSMGIVKGGGEYAEGIKVKITAVPNEGYIFVMWNDGNTDNPRTVTAANKTYTAIFEEQQQSVDQITNNQSQTTNKIIKDNHIYILRDGKIFDLTGKEVR